MGKMAILGSQQSLLRVMPVLGELQKKVLYFYVQEHGILKIRYPRQFWPNTGSNNQIFNEHKKVKYVYTQIWPGGWKLRHTQK